MCYFGASLARQFDAVVHVDRTHALHPLDRPRPIRPGCEARAEEKSPDRKSGLKSLNAVITVRHLLREEKQGMTALRLSFTDHFSRSVTLLSAR
jgi:hypothetical protein